MSEPVTRLFPTPAEETPLNGLYLRQNIRKQAEPTNRAYIFANFVTSLDGRIAVAAPGESKASLAEAVTNPRDWRLFQELAVQADLLITSGRYLREYASGARQEILQVYDDPTFADLKEWRLEQGLPAQPALAVISRSLDFQVPPNLAEAGRALLVFTTQDADPQRIRTLEDQSATVILAGEQSVSGALLAQAAHERGYHWVYSAAGPKILHLLLSGGALDRLYLTFANRILGGSPFASIVEGPLLQPPADFILQSMYLDPHALDGLGQLFASYTRVLRD